MSVTTRPPRKCLKPGCCKFGNWKRSYCDEHDSQRTDSRTPRPLQELYSGRTYRDRFRPRIMSLNPICQRLVDGAQCTQPGTELHHLKEPHCNAEFFDPKNVVMLCAPHHPGGRRGTPEWREGIDYVATRWETPCF